MRAATPPAALAAGGLLNRQTPARISLILAAAGELIADKLPITPSRTDPAGVIGRVVSGAICGRTVAGPLGAALAAGVAAGSTFLCHDARAAAGKRTGLPDLPFALIEDALAVSLAAAAVRLAGDASGPPAGAHPVPR
jgi:uncharacterized membrane protein